MHVIRDKNNPILQPVIENPWEAYATFNGCPIQVGNKIHLLYRAMSFQQEQSGANLHLSTIGHAVSDDGIVFSNRQQLINPEHDWEKFGCEDPRVSFVDDRYVITYTALSKYPFEADGIKIGLATSLDLKSIQEKNLATTFNSKAMAIFPRRINGKLFAILTVHTDKPPVKIAVAQFDSIGQMWSKDHWEKWYPNVDDYSLPLSRINRDHMEVGAPPVETKYGWLLIYSYIQDYTTSSPIFGIEAVLLEKDNPQHVIGRIESPLFIPQAPYEIRGIIPNVIFPSGALLQGENLSVYYGATDSTCCVVHVKLDDIFKHVRTSAVHIPKLKKYKNNPVLEPISDHAWESKSVFNPTAFYLDSAVHIIYRAMSDDNTSVMGYAVSRDGVHIDERLHEPIYTPRDPFEAKKKIGGNSGCEDGRVTQIKDRIYMCYTAYNGVDVPRVALTSISVKDFLSRNWNWKAPIIISPPGVDDKDACILPEKINGKYVLMHRVQGDIAIDYMNDLEFEDNRFLVCHGYINAGAYPWDSAKVGICAAPVMIDDAWLLLYHGIHPGDKEYRIGAMLLDADNPVKIISLSEFPILEPEAKHEREGIVNNVVFPCGAVIINNILYVYYGGADKVVCIATYECDKLVAYLKERRSKKMLL